MRGVRLSDRLIDYLPNVHTDQAPTEPVLDTVVVGEVVKAEAGTAFLVPEGDFPEGAPNDGQTEVPFDSEEADWRTIHATVKVSQSLGSEEAEGGEVEIGFVVDPDVDAALYMEGLRNLGPAVFFADTENPAFDYDEDVRGIAGGAGSMIATIDSDGLLALPLMREASAADFLADSPTLDALLEEARSPDRTIRWPTPGPTPDP